MPGMMMKNYALILLILFSFPVMAKFTGLDNGYSIKNKINLVEKHINSTEQAIQESLDANHLPELYLKLAEFQSKKSSLLVTLKNLRFQNGISDFQLEHRFYRKALVTYDQFLQKFSKHPQRHQVMFLKAGVFRVLQESKNMERTLLKLVQKFSQK